MKKLIYLVLSVLFAISGIYGIYDTITTPQDDLTTSIMTVLLLAFLAWFFWHLFLKPEPRHKHQAANAPESSPEATSDAPTVETAPITHADTNDGVEDDYVAIDIETTGLGRSARIIELGAVRMRHGRKVASFSQLVNPQIPIPAKVTQITGITDRNVKGKPTIDKALPKFYAFCGHDTWIGHNIRRFDLPVIAREAQRVGAGMPDVSFYDTMELSQALLPQLDHHRVVDLIRYFGIAKTERHRAADDAAQTAQIFECLKRI
ncbi:PolC-type DNA polymerase III [Bifidobacterium adolescentis]|uniref:3'-5' exonuclease n=1 Tax=Bifidobacterium adolescentis TaxID=1680 RepID=UPI0022E2ECB3|nr:3'-5' exonuclease [Bifidobacterium adolescentis]